MFKHCVVFMALLGFFAVPAMSFAEEEPSTTEPSTVRDSWGGVRVRFADDGTPILESKSTQTDATAFEPEPVDWTLFDAAQKVMTAYNVSPLDIVAVQPVVPINADGSRGDSTEVVVTEGGKWLYYNPSTGSVSNVPPPSFSDATEMDIYGAYVQLLRDASDCRNQHWGVVFYLPTCFYETTLGSGRFDGILDAWAPDPTCSFWCRYACAGYLCGSAWEGPGYLEWWNFQEGCSVSRASVRAAKIVQKRWLYTWYLCHGRSSTEIARSVRARVRF